MTYSSEIWCVPWNGWISRWNRDNGLSRVKAWVTGHYFEESFKGNKGPHRYYLPFSIYQKWFESSLISTKAPLKPVCYQSYSLLLKGQHMGARSRQANTPNVVSEKRWYPVMGLYLLQACSNVPSTPTHLFSAVNSGHLLVDNWYHFYHVVTPCNR